MDSQNSTQAHSEPPESTWTYPTRLCRLCFEDVVPTVTMYPPGLPLTLQHPVVEYKNDDEYGRLIKPCHCKGGMRYVHELCLRRQRTEGVRQDSSWKCPTCGHCFNFQKLKLQKFLASRGSALVFTFLLLIIMIFILGFVADPILNLYIDPYDTLATNDYWHTVDELNDFKKGKFSSWSLHFMKGLVSVGVVGFMKTLALNPWNWWNWRNTGLIGGRRRTSNAGRDNAVNISWAAVAIGVASAIYLFYQWMQSLVAYALLRVGERVVDTHLPGDDDDIKPPPGWKSPSPTDEASQTNKASSRPQQSSSSDKTNETRPEMSQ